MCTHICTHTRTHPHTRMHTRTRAHACAYTHAHHAHAKQSHAHRYPINTAITAYNAFFAYGVTRCSTTRRKRLKTAVFQPCNGCFLTMPTIGAPIPAHNGQTIDAPMHRRDNARRYINEKTRTGRVKGLVCYWLRDALIASLSA